jgi:hypothetical protein
MLILERALEVIGRSLPLLCVEFIVIAALVFTEQGRAFLAIEQAAVLAYVTVLLIGIPLIFYARSLAPVLQVNAQNANDEDTRGRWIGTWCGSIVVGTIGALMLPVMIAVYVTLQEGELSTRFAESLLGSAAI